MYSISRDIVLVDDKIDFSKFKKWEYTASQYVCCYYFYLLTFHFSSLCPTKSTVLLIIFVLSTEQWGTTLPLYACYCVWRWDSSLKMVVYHILTANTENPWFQLIHLHEKMWHFFLIRLLICFFKIKEICKMWLNLHTHF